MSIVRAKCRCVTANVGDGQSVSRGIYLVPVISFDPESENGKFFAATPGGAINLNVVRPEVAAKFEVGKEYYVDFTPAEVDRQHAFENAPKEKQEITQDDVGSAEDVLGDLLKG